MKSKKSVIVTGERFHLGSNSIEFTWYDGPVQFLVLYDKWYFLLLQHRTFGTNRKYFHCLFPCDVGISEMTNRQPGDHVISQDDINRNRNIGCVFIEVSGIERIVKSIYKSKTIPTQVKSRSIEEIANDSSLDPNLENILKTLDKIPSFPEKQENTSHRKGKNDATHT